VSDPVIYSSDFSPQPPNLFTASLSFWENRLKVVYPFPQTPDFIEVFSILQKLNIADFTVSVKNCNNSQMSQSNINTSNTISLFSRNFLFNWNGKIKLSVSLNKLNSTKSVFTIKSIFKHFSLIFTAFNRYCVSFIRAFQFNLEKEGKFPSMLKNRYNTRIIHSDGKPINFGKRRLLFQSSIKKLLVKFSPRIIGFHNHVPYFLDCLRRHIESVLNLFVKFFVQNALQVFTRHVSNKSFIKPVLQYVRSINSRYGLVSINKIKSRIARNLRVLILLDTLKTRLRATCT